MDEKERVHRGERETRGGVSQSRDWGWLAAPESIPSKRSRIAGIEILPGGK